MSKTAVGTVYTAFITYPRAKTNVIYFVPAKGTDICEDPCPNDQEETILVPKFSLCLFVFNEITCNSCSVQIENIITNMLTTSTTPVIVGYDGSTPIYSVYVTYNGTMARDVDVECGNIGTNHTILAVMGCTKATASANNIYQHFPIGPFFTTSYNYSNGKVYVRQILTAVTYVDFACRVNYIYK